VRSECDYCDLPLAAILEAEAEIASSACVDVHTERHLVLLSANQESLLTAQAYAQLAASHTPWLEISVEPTGAVLDTIVNSPLSPSLTVLLGTKVVGQWIGLDPAHMDDVVTSYVEAACGVESTHLATARVVSAAGDVLPQAHLATLNVNQESAVVLFGDAGCGACIELAPHVLDLASTALSAGLAFRYVDSTSSQESRLHRVENVEHARGLFPELRGLETIAPRLAASADVAPEYERVLVEMPPEALRVADPLRVATSAIAGGVVPSAMLVDAEGAVVWLTPFTASDTAQSYANRLTALVGDVPQNATP